jgi:hypothetical protein
MAFISGGRLESATGGTISTISGYKVHTFDTVGNNTFTPTTNGIIEVLVVGGGSAGSAQTGGSGGGGGGSVLYQNFISVLAGVAYTMNIGAGGTNGNPGTDTVINLPIGTVTAYGSPISGIGSYGNFTLAANSYTRSVGQTVTFSSNTVLTNGTTVYYDIVGVTSSIFTDNNLTGTTTVSDGAIVPISKTITGIGNKSFTLNLRANSNNGPIMSTLNTPVTVVPAYTFSSIPTSIAEGSSGTFNVSSNGLANITLYWNINHITTTDADFSATSGSFNITNSTGSFSVPIANDQLVDGSETFTVSIRIDGPTGEIASTSSAVTINNTTLATTASATTIGEGSSVTFTTQAQGFANGTTLYYDIVGGAGISAGDFTSNSLSGTYTVSSGTATTTITASSDGIPDAGETFQLGVKTSAGGSILTYSPVITIIESLYSFTSFTFTNGTAEGTTGPTLANLQSAYAAQSWASNTSYLNLFNSTQGYQRWTVPESGTYRITASGAQGGAGKWNSCFGGFGAKMQATISLAQGEFMIFVIGQRGGYIDNSGSGSAGGGGGTFVFKNNLSTPILVAGGGSGGGGNSSPVNGKSGETTNAGGTNSYGNVGGSNGGGGFTYSGGGGGAGITGYGGAGGDTAGGGVDITNATGTGGRGGSCSSSQTQTIGGRNFNSLGQDQGGFGGGGGGEWCSQGGVGGGGGYSGGAGNNGSTGVGGGGGSFVNQSLATLIGTSNGTYNGAGSFANIGFNGSATLNTIFSNLMGSVLVEKL